MKQKTKIYMLGFLVLFSLFAIYLLNQNHHLFQVVCTKYAWTETVCSQWTTKYNTCYHTCTKTVTDCSKCGVDKSNMIWDYCTSSPSCAYPNDFWVLVGNSWCKNKDNIDVPYACFHYVCKSCSVSYKCNPYQCNPYQDCTQVKQVTKTGTSCPSGRNCQCVESFESCGNGICEPQYNENEQNCAVDCAPKITQPTEPQMMSVSLYLSNIVNTIWNWLHSLFTFQIMQSSQTKTYVVNQQAEFNLVLGDELKNIKLDQDWSDGTYERFYATWFIMDSNKHVVKHGNWDELHQLGWSKKVTFTTDKTGKYAIVDLVVKVKQTWQNGKWITSKPQLVYKEADSFEYILPKPTAPSTSNWGNWFTVILDKIWAFFAQLFG